MLKLQEKWGFPIPILVKKINKLESNLGVSLLSRSTRAMSITPAGEAFLPYCEKVVRASQEGHHLITNLNTSVSGHIKIAAPPAFATYCLAEAVDEFCKAYPHVTIQLVLGPH